MKYVAFFFLLVSLCLAGCNPEDGTDYCLVSECGRYSYAIVDSETNENLVGQNRTYDPDDVELLDTAGNPIAYDTYYKDWADWWEFIFNYHDLVQRCDLHKTDSTFIIRVLVKLSESDIDTLDHRIAPCRNFDAVLYNGNDHTAAPTDFFGDNLNPNGLSSFHLRKKTINP